ncbi:MAG: hypothetical protein C0482_07700 [Gordonia sp.]|jgi:hypothetical protein|uniref:Uncharacterized protein n=1 Tax=Gordonia rubripertincta TaxID=36822 RepID=A0ABT4N267_GORRU|nr:hypothetical protein [Gordonia rubripertincta]MBA4022234.1 hypothetical protein [Gordonia sp. (in: high G+C Gram-positive bacteria)]MCZ4553358.1 hypothetical protein [Gordonia rubripertincta]
MQVTSDENVFRRSHSAHEARWEGVVVLQLRHIGKGPSARPDERGFRDRGNRTLTQLVIAAADAARDKPAVISRDNDYAVSFGELKARAQSAAIAMASESGIDDSALTVALMTAVPGLAVAGPKGLADTLTAIRIQAMMVLAEPQQV